MAEPWFLAEAEPYLPPLQRVSTYRGEVAHYAHGLQGEYLCDHSLPFYERYDADPDLKDCRVCARRAKELA